MKSRAGLDDAFFPPCKLQKTRNCATANENCISVLKDGNILSQILLFSGCWKNLRMASRFFYTESNLQLKQLVLHQNTDKAMIKQIILCVPNVSALILDRLQSVDNDLLLFILKHCPNLKYLSLAYCDYFDCSVFEAKRRTLRINIHGCWKLLSPHPTMSPLTVVENQLLAFRAFLNGSPDGITQATAYLSPSRKSILESLFIPTIKPKYLPLAAYTSFCVRQINLASSFIPRCGAAFLISVCIASGDAKHYLWTLSQERTMPSLKGCWMTDLIYPIEHPLLRTLSFSKPDSL
mmetsp:Transcript_37495/g.49404  ORF Transcript_37495/g.49404 Transcript_37495/m.49404 type:complete len:293 (-) Transcript_37495:256-1134(-)